MLNSDQRLSVDICTKTESVLDECECAYTGCMTEQRREAFCSAAAKLECEIPEMDGEAEHVHQLVACPPKLAVSVIVNNLKLVSSRMLRQQNTHLRMQSKTGLLWSGSDFACSTGGATIETLRAYIENQATPDCSLKPSGL